MAILGRYSKYKMFKLKANTILSLIIFSNLNPTEYKFTVDNKTIIELYHARLRSPQGGLILVCSKLGPPATSASWCMVALSGAARTHARTPDARRATARSTVTAAPPPQMRKKLLGRRPSVAPATPLPPLPRPPAARLPWGCQLEKCAGTWRDFW